MIGPSVALAMLVHGRCYMAVDETVDDPLVCIRPPGHSGEHAPFYPRWAHRHELLTLDEHEPSPRFCGLTPGHPGEHKEERVIARLYLPLVMGTFASVLRELARDYPDARIVAGAETGIVEFWSAAE